MENDNDKPSPSTELFDLVVRGVLAPTFGCLGMIFNIMIIIVLRRPEFTKVSINLIMLCKFTKFLVLIVRIHQFHNIFFSIVSKGITHLYFKRGVLKSLYLFVSNHYQGRSKSFLVSLFPEFICSAPGSYGTFELY